jgi:hypothetical protein
MFLQERWSSATLLGSFHPEIKLKGRAYAQISQRERAWTIRNQYTNYAEESPAGIVLCVPGDGAAELVLVRVTTGEVAIQLAFVWSTPISCLWQ